MLQLRGETTPQGHLEKLLVENFKSYEGFHEIGPFDHFTCIIGPNGAGKSNVMDAISFCLGIRAKELRGERLKDLVYRREEESAGENRRSARVALLFRAASGEVLQFGRSINAAGQSAYLFGVEDDLQNVPYDDFVQRLAERGLSVKARNFLVFQGDVMEFARRQGPELAGVLEAISGSELLREDYGRLAQELEILQERVRLNFQQRREAEAAVAAFAEQLEELARYQALRRNRDALLLEMNLLKLFCAECEGARQGGRAEEAEEQVKKCEAEWREAKALVQEKEAAFAGARAKAAVAASRAEALRRTLESRRQEIASCHRQTAHWGKKLQEREGQLRSEELRREAGAEELRRAREARLGKEKEMAEIQAQPPASAIEMTSEQRERYERASAESDAAAAQMRAQLQEVEDSLVMVAREEALNQRDIAEQEGRKRRGQAKLAELEAECKEVEEERQAALPVLEQRQQEAVVAAEGVAKFDALREGLLEEQRTSRNELDAARAHLDQLDLVEARQRIADELRAAFPAGVLGRLTELVLPTQQKFDLALQMALGGSTEAFIVTDGHTGRECVRYLKERRIPPETFYQLDRLLEPDVGAVEALTRGREGRWLAISCIQHNKNFLERHPAWQAEGARMIEKTLKFLLSGVVFVEGMEEAKTTAYVDARQQGLQPRVVTLDGEVISPNGNMQIQSGGSRQRVKLGTTDDIAEIRTKAANLARLEQDLAAVEAQRKEKRQQEAELRQQAREMEVAQEAQGQRLRRLREGLAAEGRLAAAAARRAADLEVGAEKAKSRREGLEAGLRALEASVASSGRAFFEALSLELGVADVRELVRSEQRERRRQRLVVEGLEDEARRLLAEERGLEERLRSRREVEGMQQDCERYKGDLAALEERRQALEEKEEKEEVNFAASRQEAQELGARSLALEQEAASGRAEAKRVRARVADANRQLKAQQEKLRAALTLLCTVLRECAERHVEIPLLEPQESEGGGAAAEAALWRPQDLEDLPLRDLEAVCNAVEVDYAGLSKQKRVQGSEMTMSELAKEEEEYRACIAEVTKKLEDLNPNMRAAEECAAEEAKLQEIMERATAVSVDCFRVQAEFGTVKRERVRRFMTCYKHVESYVSPCYKDLTSYDGLDGGSAYLDVEDVEEPYNGSITFTACPPGKRFFPMDLLSGGEKSMASMALFFSLHSYKPPPFMILDEVDAPLDRKNTASLVKYLRKTNIQCLVISLKDGFFSQSDSIIGVFREQQLQSSGIVTLPLARLGEEALALAPGDVEDLMAPIEDAASDDDVEEQNHGQHVGVFLCGNPAISQELQRQCKLHTDILVNDGAPSTDSKGGTAGSCRPLAAL